MKMAMVSIYDVKAEAWTAPMFFQAPGQAIRSFSDAVNKADSEFAAHPEDYTLFMMGEFDPQTGEITVQSAPVPLARGIEHVRQSDQLELIKKERRA